MQSVKRAAVVIVSYGSAELVDRNVTPLSTEWSDLDVIVVDCYSDDAQRGRVRELCRRRGWSSVLLDDNLGFGGGVNRGADYALERGADVLLVVNPDASLRGPDARALAAAAAEDPAALVAPVIRRPDGSMWTEGVDLYLDDGSMAGIRHRDKHGGRTRMFWVSGACFALSSDLWRRLGGLDDSYFLYWEDVDLCRRVHELGGTVSVTAQAQAIHDEGATHDDRRAGNVKSETYYYYNIRNRQLFAQRNLPIKEREHWGRATIRVSWAILLQGGRRQFLFSLAPWRALRSGLRDGRRGVTGALRR